MQHNKSKLIHDALLTCEELKTFTKCRTLEELESDRGLQLIVERLFEVLGEALYRLRNLDEAAFVQLTDGARIIGTRNILAHGYDIVDHLLLWDAIRLGLPKLEEELAKLL